MAVALVLASASPRRRALLAQLDVEFEVVPSAVPEVPEPGETAGAFAVRVARAKGADIAAQRPQQWVLAADTVVECDGEILGKPRDRSDAGRMMRQLSGTTHRVLTAVALFAPGGVPAEEIAVESAVTFRHVTHDEIEAHLDSDEPYDKAGGYGVQGLAGRFVTAVAGSSTNVIGLPLDEVRDLLRRHGRLSATTRSAAAPA